MTAIQDFDHSVLAVNDLILAERFYGHVLGEVLGGEIDTPTMHTTEEILRQVRGATLMQERARQAGEAEPGPRVSAPHTGVRVGEALIPLFLLTRHVQEPPPEQLRGTPRLAFHVTAEQMDRLTDVLKRHKVAFEGPVEHAEPCPVVRSIYLKDPSSNFLELATPR